MRHTLLVVISLLLLTPALALVCGNGICEAGESTYCCKDCGCSTDYSCQATGLTRFVGQNFVLTLQTDVTYDNYTITFRGVDTRTWDKTLFEVRTPNGNSTMADSITLSAGQTGTGFSGATGLRLNTLYNTTQTDWFANITVNNGPVEQNIFSCVKKQLAPVLPTPIVTKKPIGALCKTGSECQSGFCVRSRVFWWSTLGRCGRTAFII